ncbi:MAG: serine protease [Nanopusillaceae archaeon]
MGVWRGTTFRSLDRLWTARHVLEGAWVEDTGDLLPLTRLLVEPVLTPVRRETRLSLVSRDYDVALLEAVEDLVNLPMGQARDLRVGELVVVVASPETIVSGVTAYAGIGQVTHTSHTTPALFRYSIPVQPGSSGGVVLNLDGKVVGMNVLMEQENQKTFGVGIKAEALEAILRGEIYAPPPQAVLTSGYARWLFLAGVVAALPLAMLVGGHRR